jgi:hypothetical protein
MNDAVNIVNYCKNLNKEDFFDTAFLENEFILKLGLNDEFLNEQPKEFSDYFGKGLGCKIWQYPNQFSKYLKFIAEYSSKINSYLEIGCRFGGTYICHTELLKKQNVNFKKSVALDIIEIPNLLNDYITLNNICSFFRVDSISEEFKNFINNSFFDLIFIDGNHSYPYVKNDFNLTVNKTNMLVFHDICSDACPGVYQAWNEAKIYCKDTHKAYEFTDQYLSVAGKFLGIGVLVRKDWVG